MDEEKRKIWRKGERGERKKKALSHLAPPQKILDPQLDKRKG